MNGEKAAQACAGQADKPKKKKFLDRYTGDMPRAMQKGKYAFIIVFLLLPIVNFGIFYIGVNFQSILMAFQTPIGNTGVKWGFDNFINFFENIGADAKSLMTALGNTLLLFAVSTFIMVPLSFLITFCFYKKLTGHKFFRVIIFLPSIMPVMVAITSFKNVFGSNGAINHILDEVGLSRMFPIFDSDKYAMLGVLFYCIWAGLSTNMLLFQGAMNRIPEDVLEAARIDGASPRQELFYMIIPMMFDTLSTILLLHIAGIFTVTGPILLLTGGYHNTQTIQFWIYEQTVGGRINFPAAAGILFTLINLPIVIVARKIMRKLDPQVDY